jgi:hypothetical protein
MHVVITPIILGRGERLWDGLEKLEERFDVEAVSTPSGVTHVTFSRPWAGRDQAPKTVIPGESGTFDNRFTRQSPRCSRLDL